MKKTLTFFPWLRVESEISTEKFKLIPFNSSTQSQQQFDSCNHELIKKVISAYRSHGKSAAPINKAVVLKLAHHELMDDLNDKEIKQIFNYRSALSFAGLAKRQFYGLGPYYNYGNFEMIIQPILGARVDVGYSTQRRDGYISNLWSEEEYSRYQPEHVSIEQVIIDESLLSSILKAISCSNNKFSSNILAAIQHYNAANTDSLIIDSGVQLILLCGAFEIILGNKKTKKEDFYQNLESKLNISEEFKSIELSRMKDLQFLEALQKNKFNRIYTLWAGDFYQARNQLRHGHNISQNTLWSEREHLLLASYLFPLLLKKILFHLGFYNWKTEDEDQLNTFEHFACTEPFKDSLAWAKAWESANSKITQKKIIEEIKANPKVLQIFSRSHPADTDPYGHS